MAPDKILSVAGFLLLLCIKSINSQAACFTPSEEVGQCILLKSCDVLYNIILKSNGQLTTEQRTLISKSWCGTENNQHKVCCPQPLVTTTTTTLTSRANLVSLTPTDYSTHANAKNFDFRTCGNVIFDRIYNGNATLPFDFPWMAILQYQNLNNDIEQNCGGTLITKRFVLTAAHCITLLRSDIKLHSVLLGEHNTKTAIDCVSPDDCADPPQVILIDRIIAHPLYDKRLFTNDIGLVHLKEAPILSDSVKRICLPLTRELQTLNLANVIVTGWGKTENGSASDSLLKAQIETIPNAQCNDKYKARYRGRISITAIHMCAGGDQSDSCQGDSGGPAVYPTESGQYGSRIVQFGIVSAGASQCGVNYGIPGLYARTAPYMNWILDTCNE